MKNTSNKTTNPSEHSKKQAAPTEVEVEIDEYELDDSSSCGCGCHGSKLRY